MNLPSAWIVLALSMLSGDGVDQETAPACNPLDLDTVFSRSENVFLARLFSNGHFDEATKFNLVFDVTEILKGPHDKSDSPDMIVSLVANTEVWSDPPSYFPLNESYLLFLFETELAIVRCDQVVRLADYAADWYQRYKNAESAKVTK